MNSILEQLVEFEEGRCQDGYSVRNFPFYYLAAIQRRLQENMARALRAYDVTPQEWRILVCLNETDGLSASEVSAATVLDRSRASRIIDGLEQRGLLEKSSHAKDKRVSLVQITEKGREKFVEILPVASGVQHRILRDFNENEVQALMGFLIRMRNNAFDDL